MRQSQLQAEPFVIPEYNGVDPIGRRNLSSVHHHAQDLTEPSTGGVDDKGC